MVSLSHSQMVVLRFTLDGTPQQWVAPVDLVAGNMSALRGVHRLVVPIKLSGRHSKEELKLVFVQKNETFLTSISGFDSPRQYLLYQSAIPLSLNTATRLVETLRKNKLWRQAEGFGDKQEASLYRL